MIILKKIWVLLLVLCLIVSAFSGCSKNNVPTISDGLNNLDNSSAIASVPKSEIISSEQEVSSESSAQTATESSSSEEASSKETATSSAQSSSAVSSAVTSSKPTSVPAIASSTPSSQPQATVSNYTVNDPENKRGLSTKSYGVDYGTATNEVRPAPSIANQNRFDGYSGVKALALDQKTSEKIMYLTFDNGYEYLNLTGKILDVLKEKNVKASFFITLSYAKRNPQFVKRMINEGHIVGNHSATHPDFTTITRTEMAKELYDMDDYMQKNFGYKTSYFRFPSGNHSENSLELVTSVGYRSVFWSVAYKDWDRDLQRGTQFAYDSVTAQFHPGAVILLHAVSVDNTNALASIIDAAHQKGYRLATLDEYAW